MTIPQQRKAEALVEAVQTRRTADQVCHRRRVEGVGAWPGVNPLELVRRWTGYGRDIENQAPQGVDEVTLATGAIRPLDRTPGRTVEAEAIGIADPCPGLGTRGSQPRIDGAFGRHQQAGDLRREVPVEESQDQHAGRLGRGFPDARVPGDEQQLLIRRVTLVMCTDDAEAGLERLVIE
jgi:hypothetical protein